MKTINDIQGEIQLIINTHINLEDRLNALRASGYTGITFSWVKGGGIGKVFYLKRKRIYRIQVSASEIRGKFPIAYCVVIPATLT
jgi:nitrogen regulatory protein PII